MEILTAQVSQRRGASWLGARETAYPLGPRFAGPRQGLAGGCAPCDPPNGNRLSSRVAALRSPETTGRYDVLPMHLTDSRRIPNATSNRLDSLSLPRGWSTFDRTGVLQSISRAAGALTEGVGSGPPRVDPHDVGRAQRPRLPRLPNDVHPTERREETAVDPWMAGLPGRRGPVLDADGQGSFVMGPDVGSRQARRIRIASA